MRFSVFSVQRFQLSRGFSARVWHEEEAEGRREAANHREEEVGAGRAEIGDHRRKNLQETKKISQARIQKLCRQNWSRS